MRKAKVKLVLSNCYDATNVFAFYQRIATTLVALMDEFSKIRCFESEAGILGQTKHQVHILHGLS
jgi:hypothetical protein